MATVLPGIALAILVAILTQGCAPQSSNVQDTLVFGTPLQPNTLNPITAPDLASRYAIEMIFDGLVGADDKLQLHGVLATSWEVSPDGTIWTFHLRKGVKWHDGRELSSDDVKFTYDTVIDPGAKPTVAKTDYASIREVEAVDPYTVRFHLSTPNAAFLSRLTLGIAPRHLLQGQDLATTSFNRHPVGTGPFIFESWRQGDTITLRRNSQYFGAVPKVDRLIWRVVPDANALGLQTITGEVDAAPVLNPRDLPTLRESSRITVYETVEGNTQISLQQRNPLFQDVRVRRALAYAVDTRAIISGVLQGAGVPSSSDILPNSWAYNPNVATYSYDPPRARALLAEAGWRLGSDGTYARDGKRFEFDLATDAGNKTREQTLLSVKQYWDDLGLDVKASVQERNSFISQKVLTGNFDAVLLQSSVQIDPDISRRFHSTSIQNGQNFLTYRNPRVDRLLEDGLASTDPDARKRAYFEVQSIVAEDVPQINLFYATSAYAFKKGIQGVRPSPTNIFWNAAEWSWK